MVCDKFGECIEENFNESKQVKCPNKNSKRCVLSSDMRSKVKCEERGKTYILENTGKKHVVNYQVDGGIIVEDKTVPRGTGRCDYCYTVGAPNDTAILIELKGTCVTKSLTQIRDTLELYKDTFKKFSHVYGRAVVASSVPNLKTSPEYVNLRKMLGQKYHGNIKISERKKEEKDTDLEKEE